MPEKLFSNQTEKNQIIATVSYHAPLGVAGESTTKLLNPYYEKLMKNDIMNFKMYLESV
ncbi:hypothetical protein [Flavobacterium sp. 3-210]